MKLLNGKNHPEKKHQFDGANKKNDVKTILRENSIDYLYRYFFALRCIGTAIICCG